MGLVIFGFMWLNRGDQAKLQQEQQEQAVKEQERAHAEAERALRIDTLTPAEVAAVPAIMRAVGPDSTGLMHIRTPKVALSYDGQTVTGHVTALDTALTYEALAASQFGDDLTPDNRRAALKNFRDAVGQADRYRSFSRYLDGDEQTVSLANDVLQLELTTHGGMINRAVLQHYDTYLPKPGTTNDIDTAAVEIFRPGDVAYSFVLTSATQRFDTSNFYFVPQQESDSTVVMRLDLGAGAYYGLRYTLPKGSYVVKMEVVQQGMDRIVPSSVATADFLWHQKMGRNEVGRVFEERNSSIFYKFVGDNATELSYDKDKQKSLEQRVRWIGFVNQFFSAIAIPDQPFAAAQVESKVLKDDPDFVKDMDARAVLEYSSVSETPATFHFFLGPNSYPLLRKLSNTIQTENPDGDLDLTRVIPLGWPIFRWVNIWIIIPLFTFLSKFISSYGLIIFILTVLIKIILFPFTYKSYVAQAKMRVLAPDIKEINEHFPGQENAMKRQQETMALYRKAGASPFSGCLPTLLQMPVLIAMFSFFPSCIELRGEGFLWAHNLAAPDFIFSLPFTIPWYGNKVSLFCLLMTVTNVIYMYLNQQSQASSQSMPGMKYMMYFMPVMFLFIFNDYASGLSYYYFLSLLITIIQTYAFRWVIDEKKMRRQMAENAKKPQKKSGWMARLEEAQRKQQAALRAQQNQKKR